MKFAGFQVIVFAATLSIALSDDDLDAIPHSFLGSIQRCDEPVLKEIEIERQKCVAEREKEYHSSTGTKTQADLCAFLHDIIEGCGEAYKKCYNDDQLRRFKKTQLDIFKQLSSNYGEIGLSLESCDIYTEHDDVEHKKCTPKQISALSQRYTECTINCNKKWSQQISEPEFLQRLGAKMEDIVCDFVNRIIGCAELLRECFSDEEVESTIHVQETETRKIWDALNVPKSMDCSKYFGSPSTVGCLDEDYDTHDDNHHHDHHNHRSSANSILFSSTVATALTALLLFFKFVSS